MENGLAQWYNEMQTQGLAEKGPNAVGEFILHGVRPFSPQDETEEAV